MRRPMFPLLLAIAMLSGCAKNAQDQQADNLRAAAQSQAEKIETEAAVEAKALDDQSKSLAAQAKQTGGFTGQRLQVRADSLAKEAEIVTKQARTRAEATREAADAQAKQIASR